MLPLPRSKGPPLLLLRCRLSSFLRGPTPFATDGGLHGAEWGLDHSDASRRVPGKSKPNKLQARRTNPGGLQPTGYGLRHHRPCVKCVILGCDAVLNPAVVHAEKLSRNVSSQLATPGRR